METSMADKDDYRITKMEKNMETLTTELTEIKELLKSTTASPSVSPLVPTINEIDTSTGSKNNKNQSNFWEDTERLATVIAPVESDELGKGNGRKCKFPVRKS